MLAVALLGGTIMIARSPSSALAIIKELRAWGPFTRLGLGVTVIMDAVVIVLYAVSAEVADVVLTGVGGVAGTVVFPETGSGAPSVQVQLFRIGGSGPELVATETTSVFVKLSGGGTSSPQL